MELVEHEIRTPINETSCISGYDRDAKLARRGGRWFARFDFEDPVDRLQWETFWERGAIAIDGHKPKDLAAVSLAFNEPETIALMKELAKVRSQLPELEDKADAAAAEAEVVKVALDQNADLAAVPDMIKELRKRRDLAEEAEVTRDTARRLIEKLENQIKDVVRTRRQHDAEQGKARLHAAVETINRTLEQAYAEFWAAAKELFSSIHENDHGFPPGVQYRTPQFNNADGMALKAFAAHPVISILPSGQLWFKLQPVGKQAQEANGKRGER